MRLRLSLRPTTPEPRVPINYQYPLSAVIYKILQQAAPEYARFLHSKGYPAPTGRLMKLFTFSKLWIPGGRRDGRTLVGQNAPWTLQIGSPMLDEFVQGFVLGLFETLELVIAGQGQHARFQIEQVEALPVPPFSQTMRFKCLSPISASTMVDQGSSARIHYFRPDDRRLPQALHQNLMQKYHIIHNHAPEDTRFEFQFETQDRPKGKLIWIKEGTPEQTKVYCFESYFTLAGSVELIRTAWQCGLGERGSQGFGMVEPVIKKPQE